MQINLEIDDQGQPNWCWAAVTAAVLNHFRRTNVKPCEVAAAFLGSTDCCDRPADFDQIQRLRDVLDHFGLLREPEQNALPDDDIRAELAAQRPVPARIVFGERVHFVLITGLLANRRKVVLDPDGPIERVLTDVEMRLAFPSSSGGEVGSWSNAYLLRP